MYTEPTDLSRSARFAATGALVLCAAAALIACGDGDGTADSAPCELASQSFTLKDVFLAPQSVDLDAPSLYLSGSFAGYPEMHQGLGPFASPIDLAAAVGGTVAPYGVVPLKGGANVVLFADDAQRDRVGCAIEQMPAAVDVDVRIGSFSEG